MEIDEVLVVWECGARLLAKNIHDAQYVIRNWDTQGSRSRRPKETARVYRLVVGSEIGTKLSKLLSGVTKDNIHGETETGAKKGNEEW